MPSYQNPKIPEGINVSPDHPLKEFAWLVLAVSLGAVIIIVTLAFFAEYLVRYIPFEIEKKLSESVNQTLFQEFNVDKNDKLGSNGTEKSNNLRIEKYLQNLTSQLATHENLPEGMNITVHYFDDDTVNAFATIGGHIFMFRGLIEKLTSENSLSMVLGHEIAHIKHRDPIVSLGRGVTIGIALACITGFGDSGFSQQLIGQVGLLTSLKFSREQETEADTAAMKALQKQYGHAIGADELFVIFKALHGDSLTPEIFTTHPMDDRRIEAIQNFNQQLGNGYLATKNEGGSVLTPLPDFIMALNISTTEIND